MLAAEELDDPTESEGPLRRNVLYRIPPVDNLRSHAGPAVPLAARLHEAGLIRGDDQLGPVPGGELRHRPPGVGLDRGLTDVEPGGDLLVGQPGRQ